MSSPSIVGRNFPALDGLRAIAVLCVLMFHSRIVAAPQTALEHAYFTVVEVGWVGVDLFFVLSGFLITGILLDTVGTPGYFGRFYMRRVLRVFPLYYAMLAAVTVAGLASAAPALHTSSRAAALTYWLYLENWVLLVGWPPIDALGHFWSLAIEEQFYVVWPILIALTAPRGWTGLFCAATVVVALVVRWWLVSAGEMAYFVTVSRIDVLAVGAGLAVYLKHHGSLDVLRRPARWYAVLAAAALVTVAIARAGFYGHDPAVLRYGLLPLALLFACVLTLSVTTTGRWRAFLETPLMRGLGRVSYGVYVFHWPIALLLVGMWPAGRFGFWADQIGFALTLATVTIILAALSYRYFEGWFLAQKKRFAATLDPAELGMARPESNPTQASTNAKAA